MSLRHSGSERFAEKPNSRSASLASHGMRLRALNQPGCFDANGAVIGSRAIRLSRIEKPCLRFVVMQVLHLHLRHVDAGRAIALAALAADAEIQRVVHFVAGDAIAADLARRLPAAACSATAVSMLSSSASRDSLGTWCRRRTCGSGRCCCTFPRPLANPSAGSPPVPGPVIAPVTASFCTFQAPVERRLDRESRDSLA